MQEFKMIYDGRKGIWLVAIKFRGEWGVSKHKNVFFAIDKVAEKFGVKRPRTINMNLAPETFAERIFS